MSAGVIGGATSGMEDENVSSGCKDEGVVTWGGGGLRGGGVWAAFAAAAAVVVGADPGAAGILGSIAMETLDLAGDADSSCDKRFSIVAVISWGNLQTKMHPSPRK